VKAAVAPAPSTASPSQVASRRDLPIAQEAVSGSILRRRLFSSYVQASGQAGAAALVGVDADWAGRHMGHEPRSAPLPDLCAEDLTLAVDACLITFRPAAGGRLHHLSREVVTWFAELQLPRPAGFRGEHARWMTDGAPKTLFSTERLGSGQPTSTCEVPDEAVAFMAGYPGLDALIREARDAALDHFGRGSRVRVRAVRDPQDGSSQLCLLIQREGPVEDLRRLLREFDHYGFDLRPEACGVLTIDVRET